MAIIIVKSKHRNFEVLVDDEDVERVSQYKWHLCGNRIHLKSNRFYFQRGCYFGKKKTMEALHRFILNLKKNDGKFVDHIDHNTLDNRKENLRVCTRKENVRNRSLNKNNISTFKGVYFKKENKKWCAQIMVDNKNIHLGYFQYPEDGAIAYNIAALKYHGDFAFPNNEQKIKDTREKRLKEENRNAKKST